MNSLSIVAATLLTVTVISVYDIVKSTDEIKSNLTTVENIKNANNKQNIFNKNTLLNVKQSSLLEEQIPLQDKKKLDDLQKAINFAVLEQNIITPDCNDLAATNFISLNDCLDIKDKSFKFAKVSKEKGIETSNPEISKILTNQIYFKKESVENNITGTSGELITTSVITPINSYSMKSVKKKKEESFKKDKMIKKEISQENDVDRLFFLSDTIEQKSIRETEVGNFDTENTINAVAVYNRIAYIKNSESTSVVNDYIEVKIDETYELETPVVANTATTYLPATTTETTTPIETVQNESDDSATVIETVQNEDEIKSKTIDIFSKINLWR